MKQYETVIGLEIHIELSTKTKIFCSCPAEFGGEPNTHICPVCTGMPGALPILNKTAVEYGAAVGLALNCKISKECRFDRKNYFYPDNPQNYQITQLYQPICYDGAISIEVNSINKSIRIHDIHLEEDAGKLLHDTWGGSTMIDFNRSGVPLIEIVTEPDFSSFEEVNGFLDKLVHIIRYLGVSDCKLQEGSMRADVNLSVMEFGDKKLGTRTEMKNLNSFKAIGRAIESERARQIALLEAGDKIAQETRRWDENAGESYVMRSKEDMHDYRYFPEPDLVPVVIDSHWIAEIKKVQPEFRDEKRLRYVSEFGMTAYDADLITSSRYLAELFEETVRLCNCPKKAANWMITETMRLLNIREMEPEDIIFSPRNLAKLIRLVESGKINGNAAKEVFEAVFDKDVDPEIYVAENGLGQVSDETVLKKIIAGVLTDNPQSVSDYHKGRDRALGFLVGQVMKCTNGTANPAVVNKILKELM